MHTRLVPEEKRAAPERDTTSEGVDRVGRVGEVEAAPPPPLAGSILFPPATLRPVEEEEGC